VARPLVSAPARAGAGLDPEPGGAAGARAAAGDAAVRAGYREAARLVRARARNFAFAFVAMPAAERRALHAVYAFCRSADDAADDGRGPVEGAAALADLRARLDEVYAGSPTRALDRALQHAVRSFGIQRADFETLLRGVERDLTPARHETFEDLLGYCYDVGASVGLLCLPVFGRSDPAAQRSAVALGLGMQLTNILRDLGEDGRRGRLYLPRSDLRRFGVPEEVLTRGTPAPSPELDALVRHEAGRARRFLEEGRGLLDLLDRRSRFCPAVLGRLYGEVLDRIEALGSAVVETRVRLRVPRKAWIAAATYVRGR
jgi:phytoene synthase